MKRKVSFIGALSLSLILASSLAKAETKAGVLASADAPHFAAMYALFSGKSSKTGHQFEIKQSSDGKWSINEFKHCGYFPCEAQAERLNSLSLSPEIVSPMNLPDAGIQIQLSDTMLIHLVSDGMAMLPGSRSYYELVIFDENKAVVDHIELRLNALLDTHGGQN